VLSARTQPIQSVDRFFQFSLLGLITSAYFALAGSGYLDRPTLVLTFIGLFIRAAMVSGLLRFELPVHLVSIAAFGYIAFFPIDFYFLSRDFLATTVHGVCFLATIKILTAQSNRDYAWTGVISFVELISAALLSAQSSFFAYLTLYVVFAIAAFTSAEIRRSFQRHEQQVAPPRARMGWRLAVVAITSTSGILIITLGLFLMVPRTARMAAMLFPNAPRLTGFSNVVDLGGFGKISRDDRAVLHVLSYSRALPPDLKWRGTALSRFDGKRWSEPPLPGHTIPTVRGYAEIADLSQRSRRDGGRLIYRVDVQNASTGTLFVAGIPEFVNTEFRSLLLTSEGSLRVLAPMSESLRYEVSAHSGPPLASPLSGVERSRYLELPPLDIRIYTLAREWSGDGAPLDRALRIQSHLRSDFKYALDGPVRPVRDPLSDFLFVRKEGYCEYFASAMAVMLRAQGIPSRVATGFQSGYFNDVSGLYVVRASDAHAWVEAWIAGSSDGPAGGRWTTFDPTPSASATRAGLLSRLNMYLDAADHAWQEWVVSYDLTQQVAIAARFEAALRRLNRPSPTPNGDWTVRVVNAAKTWGAVTVAAILFIAALVFFGPQYWREWRGKARLRQIIRSGGSPSDAGALYMRMLNLLARRGFRKPPWFTPTEFARHLPVEQKARVVEFTDLYNSIRFGGNRSATSRLAVLLQEFERAGQHRAVDHLTIQ
jgi:transglutaminase-like putative cysteine protease